MKKEYSRPKSCVDERTIKSNLDKMVRKASAPPKQKDVPEKIELFGGELEDIWGNDGKAIAIVDRSNHMKRFKANFSKKDKVNVKPVINPVGGLSYNPSMKAHKKLLLEVAITEEAHVAQNLKDLKRSRPLLYAATQGEESDEEAAKPAQAQESSESEDSEDVDMNRPLSINPVVDRLGLKT